MTTSTAAALSESELSGIYQDLHCHPELSFHEVRTAGIAAERLRDVGFEVTTGVGGTGVVGVLRRGDGPTVALRADMDALPVQEATGLAYASVATWTDASGKSVPVMHACGHDVHVTCLIGAVTALAAADDWRGTVMAVFQPAEELGSGARAMVDDGMFDRFGKPDIVLGQHVAPAPAGVLGIQEGPAFASGDAIRVVLFGKGGHGSRPETTVDPVLMAAALVQRLNGLVSREIAASDTAVLTVASMQAGGEAYNIIPDHAELRMTLRTYDSGVREKVIASIGRMARAEALASGAEREPTVEIVESFPAAVNDADACERLRRAFARDVPGTVVIAPGAVTGSEDVGIFATAAGVPLMYWILGGADPAAFRGLTTIPEILDRVAALPSNHSSAYAPAISPTLRIGVDALCAAAREWLDPSAA